MQKSTIHVIENVITPEYADKIERLLFSNEFPWYLNTRTVGYLLAGDAVGVDSPQFTHTFVRDGQRTSGAWSAETLVYALEEKSNLGLSDPFRVKANLNTQDPSVSGKHYPAHIDEILDKPFLTCVYYVNDCDGDTLFFDDDFNVIERISPKKGTIAYFDGRIPHAGSAPEKSTHRCIINLNFHRESWI